MGCVLCVRGFVVPVASLTRDEVANGWDYRCGWSDCLRKVAEDSIWRPTSKFKAVSSRVWMVVKIGMRKRLACAKGQTIQSALLSKYLEKTLVRTERRPIRVYLGLYRRF
jgi:hypothetical protein